LKDYEWYNRFVDVPHSYTRWYYSFHVEQVEAEGRRQEAHLHVYHEEDSEPQRVEPQLPHYREKDGSGEHHYSGGVKEAPQDEEQELHGYQRSPAPPGH